MPQLTVSPIRHSFTRFQCYCFHHDCRYDCKKKKKKKVNSRLYRGFTYLHNIKQQIILAVSDHKVSAIKRPKIIVENVYLEYIATLKLIFKTSKKNKQPPQKTTQGEMAIVLGTFTYSQWKFQGLSYKLLLF